MPFVSGLDGRLGPTWVTRGVPQQEDCPLRPSIFRQGATRKLSATRFLLHTLTQSSSEDCRCPASSTRWSHEDVLFRRSQPVSPGIHSGLRRPDCRTASSPNGDAVSRTNATSRESMHPLPLPCGRNQMKMPWRLDFTPTPPCPKMSEENICEHNE